jgi:hypothetical protein
VSVPDAAPGRRLVARLPVETVPAWFAPAVLALAALAAFALPGHPAGLGLALAATGLCVAVAAAAPGRDVFATGCWLAAAALAVVPAVRAAGWVVALSLLAALALAAVAAAGARTWRELAAAPFGVALALVPGPLLVAAPLLRRTGARGWAWLGPVARGGLLAVLLLALFVPLLAAADAAFAALVEDVTDLRPQLDRPLARTALAVLAVTLAGALLLAALRRRERPARPARARLGGLEWAIALGALDLAFATFVGVQLSTLFGGHRHVLETEGLTYAEYARSGFFQLEVVAVLALAVVAAAARWSDGGRRTRILLGLLCALTFVLLVSALRRLGLYEDAFGATRLRLLVHVQLLWLGAVFLLVTLAIAVGDAARLPRALVAVTAAAALGFAASDPDGRIAERNVARYEATGKLDAGYLDTLSADAAPTLARLPPALRACATERLRATLATPDGVAGANLARSRARGLLPDAPCTR